MRYLQKRLSADATNQFKTHTQTHLQMLHPHPIPWGKNMLTVKLEMFPSQSHDFIRNMLDLIS